METICESIGRLVTYHLVDKYGDSLFVYGVIVLAISFIGYGFIITIKRPPKLLVVLLSGIGWYGIVMIGSHNSLDGYIKEASSKLNSISQREIKDYCDLSLFGYQKIMNGEAKDKKEIISALWAYGDPHWQCKVFLFNADLSLHHYRIDLNKTQYLKVLNYIDRRIAIISPNKRYIYPLKGVFMTKEEFQKRVEHTLKRALEVYRSKHPKDFENISASLPQETMSHQDSKRKPLRPAPKKKKKISKEKKAKVTLFLFGMLAVTFFVVLFFHLYSIRKDKRSKQ